MNHRVGDVEVADEIIDVTTHPVEVELTVKAPRRLAQICRGWARARHIRHTYYLATPAAAAAVQRAVKATRGEDRITILAVDRVPELVDTEREEARDAHVR